MQILNHVICTDIYGRPLSPLSHDVPTDPLPQLSGHRQKLWFSERARDSAKKCQKLRLTDEQTLPVLSFVPSIFGGRTVIAQSAIANHQFICELYGNVLDFEEADNSSQRPTFSHFQISNTDLVLDARPCERNSICPRIQRSFYYNCEVKLFEMNRKVRVGLFASSPSILPLIMEGDRRSETGIKPGEELLLPFDFAPVITCFEQEWRTAKEKKISFDLGVFKIKSSAISSMQDREFDKLPTASEPEPIQEVGEKCRKTKSALKDLFGSDPEFSFTLLPGSKTSSFMPSERELPASVTRIDLLKRKIPKGKTTREAIGVPNFWGYGVENEREQVARPLVIMETLMKLERPMTWTLDDDDFVDVRDKDLRLK
jgi:hypothetical protein